MVCRSAAAAAEIAKKRSSNDADAGVVKRAANDDADDGDQLSRLSSPRQLGRCSLNHWQKVQLRKGAF